MTLGSESTPAKTSAATLVSAALVVLAVCAVGLVSATGRFPQRAPREPGASDAGGTSASGANGSGPVLNLESGGLQTPETYLADIRAYGWRDRTRNLLDIKVDSARLVERVDPVSGAISGQRRSSYSDRIVGQRVLAVVDPVAARDLKAPGVSIVQMVVVPERDTVQLSISKVVSGSDRPRLGLTPAEATIAGPKVTALSTHAAGPGARVRITGTGFRPTQGDGWPTVCGVKAEVVSWSDTEVVFVVPEGLERSGYAGIVVGGSVSNGVYFAPFDPPELDSVDPRQGGAGTKVTFTGRHFGSTQGDGWVSFSGASGHVVSWSDTRIVAVVPKNVVSGYAGVVRHGLSSNGRLYSPYGYPSVAGLSSQQSLAGGAVTIRGTDFGSGPGEAIFGGVAQPILSWSNTEVTFRAPDEASAGYVGIRRPGGRTSNGIFLVVGPRLTGLSTPWAPPGGELTLTGIGFGSSQGAQLVTIDRAPVAVLSWSATSLRIRVPQDADSGYVGVGVPPGTSNGLWLTVVVQARITSVDKTVVSAGDTVTVTGRDFGPASSSSKVTIDRVPCIVRSWSDTRVVVTVPTGARSGYLGVVKQGLASNGIWVTAR